MRTQQTAQASYNRDLAALRNIRLNAFAQAETQRKRLQEEELEMTRLLLEDLNMKRLKEEEEIDREFSNRNAKRWNEINNAIADLERKEKENAAILENAKRKQLEAEAKAKELRELELKKMQQEQEEQEQRKKKEELEQKEQREKTAQAAQERAKKEKEDAGKAAVGVPAGGASSSSASSSTTKGPSPASNAVSYLLESKREFERWHTKIKELKETILPAVSNNKELKNACWKLKRSLSTRISNVSASKSDIQNTASTIHNLLIDAKSANEQAYLWSLNLLSKKITEMAGNNSEPDLSPVTYALAQIVVSLLLADHKPLGDILMARLVKRCPYIVPFFVSKGTVSFIYIFVSHRYSPRQGIIQLTLVPLLQLSPEEHSKLLGRKENEPSISYKQRMSGIISLYAAIVQTSPSSVPQLTSTPSLSSVPSHFRPEGGWRWLALIVRPPLPLLEVTALVLYTFLRISSERFHQIFGQQYIKLLKAIAEQAIDERKVKWNDAVQGDLSKIRLMIGDWMEKGQIVGAEGRIPT
jgi:nucleoporin GLE1